MFDAIRSFLWWCAGLGAAERDLLERYGLDHSKYGSIGFAVLGTGFLALATGGTAAYALTESVLIAAVFAMFWSALIFNLDRIAVSVSGESNTLVALLKASPRILLATVIGLVIAVPLELKIFEREIAAQMAADRLEQRNATDRALSGLFERREALIQANAADRKELAAGYAHIQELEEAAVAEADGSGGTGDRGAGAIYAIKLQRAQLARDDFMKAEQAAQSRIAARLITIQDLDAEIAAERSRVMAAHAQATGLLARYEALGRKADADRSVWMATTLITLLILALEVAPVLMKALLGRSFYDMARAQLVEGHGLRMGHELEVYKTRLQRDLMLEKIQHGRMIAQAVHAPMPANESGWFDVWMRWWRFDDRVKRGRKRPPSSPFAEPTVLPPRMEPPDRVRRLPRAP